MLAHCTEFGLWGKPSTTDGLKCSEWNEHDHGWRAQAYTRAQTTLCVGCLIKAEWYCPTCKAPAEHHSPKPTLPLEPMRSRSGVGWCSKAKREAIYNRDGRHCVYCNTSSDLTLDHLVPRSKCGTNRNQNLVTACFNCNTAKADTDWKVFAGLAARAAGRNETQWIRRIRELVKKPIGA